MTQPTVSKHWRKTQDRSRMPESTMYRYYRMVPMQSIYCSENYCWFCLHLEND